MIPTIFFLGVQLGHGPSHYWQVKGNLYAAQFFYGLLSFPFLVFLVPILTKFICKTHQTAYDTDGNTCPSYVGEFWYQKKYGKVKIKLDKIKAKLDAEKAKLKAETNEVKRIAKEEALKIKLEKLEIKKARQDALGSDEISIMIDDFYNAFIKFIEQRLNFLKTKKKVVSE